MLLLDFLLANKLPTTMFQRGPTCGLEQVGQFALGEKYVIQLINGNSVTVKDLDTMISIICDELRTEANYDVEVFAGQGRTSRNTLFVVPRRELGRPFGRNLRRLRENLTIWMTTFSLSGEMPADVPRRGDADRVAYRKYTFPIGT